MKLYAALHGDQRWSANHIIGVFSSFEKSKAACDAHAKKKLPLTPERTGCYAGDKFHSTYYEIDVFDLDKDYYQESNNG